MHARRVHEPVRSLLVLAPSLRHPLAVLVLANRRLVSSDCLAARPVPSPMTPADGPHLHVGIVTVSDRAAAGINPDLGRPAIARMLTEHLRTPWETHTCLVPDEQPGELMRHVSQRATPTAIMSRQLAGIRGPAVIVNLPGSPGSIADCLPIVLPAVRGCVHLLGGPTIELA